MASHRVLPPWGPRSSALAAAMLPSAGSRLADPRIAVGAGAALADRQDVLASGAGDGDAFRRIVARYQVAIAGQMHRFSRDPAVHEQLVHDVFVEAFVSLSNWRAEAPLLHWLRRIAVRVGYRHWRRRVADRAQQNLTDEQWQTLVDEQAPLNPTEAADLVHRLLSLLAPRDRLVLSLLYLDGLSIGEAGQLAGWSAVRTRLYAHRARRRLQHLVGGGGRA